jgi:hypothetical protein
MADPGSGTGQGDSRGVRAVWELAESLDKADPFQAVVYSSGVTLDLGASEHELADLYVMLLRRESGLSRRGVTCELKLSGQNCLHCPEATLDPNDRKSQLCRLGKDEFTIEGRCNELMAVRTGGVDELALLADEMTEIGRMPDHLSVLLTEVGR